MSSKQRTHNDLDEYIEYLIEQGEQEIQRRKEEEEANEPVTIRKKTRRFVSRLL